MRTGDREEVGEGSPQFFGRPVLVRCRSCERVRLAGLLEVPGLPGRMNPRCCGARSSVGKTSGGSISAANVVSLPSTPPTPSSPAPIILTTIFLPRRRFW